MVFKEILKSEKEYTKFGIRENYSSQKFSIKNLILEIFQVEKAVLKI